jgi:Na+/H+ antiporter NhaD/arsenite permease-like protein
MNHPQLVLFIFIITYIFIAVQRIPGLRIDRPAGVTIGSTLLLLTGLLTIEEAYRFIDWDVVTFLLGMMVMIAYLEFAGFFEHVALWLVRISRSGAQLLLATILSSAVLSAFFVNDTICLLFTPIILKATRFLKLNPLPYLIAIATSSNIGSALTITGNPQNMYIGIQSGIPFLKFLLVMLLPVAIGLVLNYLVIRFIFRSDINRQQITAVEARIPKLKKILAYKSLVTLAITLVLFIAGMKYPFAALIGVSILLLIAYVPPRLVLKEVDWTILLFFAGLFIVMGAFEKAGYMEALMAFASGKISGETFGGFMGLSLIVTLLSNLVSNVPAVILMQPLIEQFGGGEKFWLLLAMASTFAGNLTLIGSVANLIVAEKALDKRVHLGFIPYLKAGLPLTLLSLLVGTVWLWLVY